jgi:hypothetical protein
MSRPDIFGGVKSEKCERFVIFCAVGPVDDFSRYIEFMDASDIALLIGDIVAIVVIAFVILSSPIRYFIRKQRCCLNLPCFGKKEAPPEEEVVRRPESVLK